MDGAVRTPCILAEIDLDPTTLFTSGERLALDRLCVKLSTWGPVVDWEAEMTEAGDEFVMVIQRQLCIGFVDRDPGSLRRGGRVLDEDGRVLCSGRSVVGAIRKYIAGLPEPTDRRVSRYEHQAAA